MPQNIDDEFYEAMRPIGGLRPAEINPAAGKTLNADVVFRDENVIMEVKTLMEDPSEHADYIRKVSEIYNRWAGRPGVPIIYGQRRINSADLPLEMGRELVRTLAGPIRGAVKKANRQIRQVKASLSMSDAHGVLVLCNAGATTLTPHVILYELHHALGREHSSINSAIFLTQGVPANVPDVPEPAEIISCASRKDCQPLPRAFAAKIEDAWMQYQARKKRVRLYRGVDASKLLDAVNARKP